MDGRQVDLPQIAAGLRIISPWRLNPSEPPGQTRQRPHHPEPSIRGPQGLMQSPPAPQPCCLCNLSCSCPSEAHCAAWGLCKGGGDPTVDLGGQEPAKVGRRKTQGPGVIASWARPVESGSFSPACGMARDPRRRLPCSLIMPTPTSSIT